jgi:hypothetical protein
LLTQANRNVFLNIHLREIFTPIIFSRSGKTGFNLSETETGQKQIVALPAAVLTTAWATDFITGNLAKKKFWFAINNCLKTPSERLQKKLPTKGIQKNNVVICRF